MALVVSLLTILVVILLTAPEARVALTSPQTPSYGVTGQVAFQVLGASLIRVVLRAMTFRPDVV